MTKASDPDPSEFIRPDGGIDVEVVIGGEADSFGLPPLPEAELPEASTPAGETDRGMTVREQQTPLRADSSSLEFRPSVVSKKTMELAGTA